MDDIFNSLNYVPEQKNTYMKISYPDYGDSWSVAYPILPGIVLYLQHMHAKQIPFTLPESLEIILINYALNGRSEQTLTDGNLTYVSVGDLALSTLTTQNGSRFPSGLYEGIEIAIDVEEFHKHSAQFSLPWNLDINRLKSLCGKKQFFEASQNSYLDNLMKQLWNAGQDDSQNEYAKICILTQDILRYLCYEDIPEKKHENLSQTQAEIALEYEGILTRRLAEHISAKEVAKQFHISETSLKNYFQIEFGESVSSYMKRFRMNRAQSLLLSGRETIAEISQEVGYSSPSKFAAAFRGFYGMSPFAYRRKNREKKK